MYEIDIKKSFDGEGVVWNARVLLEGMTVASADWFATEQRALEWANDFIFTSCDSGLM